MRTKGVAMLIRSENVGVHGGAVTTARPEAIPAASHDRASLDRTTLIIGGLLLLIGP
jgi:hypothetical protein